MISLLIFNYGQDHAIIFLHRAETAEECDKKDDGANDDEECGQCEELRVEKIWVSMINALNRQSHW